MLNAGRRDKECVERIYGREDDVKDDETVMDNDGEIWFKPRITVTRHIIRWRTVSVNVGLTDDEVRTI